MIALGCAGTVVVVTPRVLAVPFPQELEGVTVIVPLFAPTVTVTEWKCHLPFVVSIPQGTTSYRGPSRDVGDTICL